MLCYVIMKIKERVEYILRTLVNIYNI